MLFGCGSSSSTTGNTDPTDTTPPSVPAGLTAAVVDATTITLSWNASSDPGGSGVLDYQVFRDGSQVAAVTATNYTSSGLTPETTYSYTVSARDNAGNVSSRSSSVSATTPPGSTPVVGLDTRPSNATCIAPDRNTGSSEITIDRVFSALSFSSPVGAVQAPGNSDRWYVVERTGRVMTFSASAPSTSTVFLDLTGAIRTAGDEEAGLLGLAFHPQFAANGRFFVFYTGAPDSGYRIQSRIAEFSSPNGLTASTASERVLIRANKAESNHNGGQLAFGPDGYLYASLGDGGAADDPHGNGQSTATLFGKIIRIDVDTGSPYGIPASNPFSGNAICPLVASGFGSGDTSRSPTPCPEIYAYGLRNPWRFTFDSGSITPDLWTGDVGQGAYEEIDHIDIAGGNYGWDIKEGPDCHEPATGCSSVGLIDPVAAAPRDSGLASIIGGYVYRGTAIPALVGRYVFTDFFTRNLYLVDAAATNGYSELLNNTGVMASSFAQDQDNELYLVAYDSGGIFKINPGTGGPGTSPVPANLSDTGCVDASNPTLPAAGLIPFAPEAPFWSDNAVKSRWLALPNGTNATIDASGDWQFPVGSVLVKSFELNGQLIETRLLMRHPDGEWAGYTYQWNAAQTDATRVIGGLVETYGTQDWVFPSEAQCLRCHTVAAGRSLSAETPQLNGDFLYEETGRTANQVRTLTHIGIIPVSTPDPSTLPVYPDPFDPATGTLEERARSYLHTNCSMCHRPNGGAAVSLDLRYSETMAATNTCNVDPVNGDLGVAGAKRIVPGDPDSSVLYLRMSRRDSMQMPPIGSTVVDSNGASLLAQWISQMDGSCNL